MTLANRVKVLKLSAAGRSSSWIAKHIGVGKTQIQNMIKIEILDEFEKNGNINANGPRRAARSDDVNELVSQWFNDANGRLSNVSGPLWKQNALSFVAYLGVTDFKASNGCPYQKRVSGEYCAKFAANSFQQTFTMQMSLPQTFTMQMRFAARLPQTLGEE